MSARRPTAAVVAIVAIILAAAAILLAMGRPPICPCGTIKLWHGVVQSSENSQHLADWYTPSHIIHGLLFYAGLRWLLPRAAPAVRLAGAVLIEAGWELLENSPMVIDRYREATIAFGYTGDSVLNSVADIGWMAVGFALAARLPVAMSVVLAIGFELLTLWLIRDNLALNVLMLLWPVAAIRAWQAGG